METVDVNNNKSSETHYVTLVDIKNMDPCSFSDKKNPISGVNCKETFKSISTNDEPVQMPDDTVAQIYFASLAIVGIYIFYRVMKKSK
jgi:hypothetical protein